MTAPLTRPPQRHQERVLVPYDHAAMSATTSVKIGGLKDRVLRIDQVWYNNPTGFAADATDYWTVAITDGTNTLASWTTHSTGQGTLTGDTPVYLVNATAHDQATGTLTVTFTKTGTPANLPAGRLLVDGHAL